MKPLFKARSLRIVGLAVGAVAVAGAAIAVTASAAGVSFGFNRNAPSQSSGAGLAAADTRPTSTVCSDFMSHFAVEIGKSQAQINTAFQKAIGDTLKDEVNSKKITQAQADQIAQKLAQQTPCTLPATLAPRSAGGPKANLGAYLKAYETAAASALGITPSELQADLKNGQSLSQVAAAHQVSEADFRTKLIANLRPALDAAVTNKQLTSAQEQALINQLKTGPLPLWNRPAMPKTPTTAPSPTPTNA